MWLYMPTILTTEGDLEKNAKLWYEQVDPSTLSIYWGGDDPNAKAIENMYRIMRAKSRNGKKTTKEETEEEGKARRIKWEEMVCAMEYLDKEHGWGVVDGTGVYTRDEDPSHKSMVLGKYGLSGLVAACCQLAGRWRDKALICR